MSRRKKKVWSYSRWKTYSTCPKKYHGQYITGKYKQESSPHLIRGNKIHKEAEDYIEGRKRTLPASLKHFKKEFLTLRKLHKKGEGFAEPDVSLNSHLEHSNLELSDYFRGFADFVHFNGADCTIIDFKTGKVYNDHRDQAHVYAMACFCIDEDIESVTVEFWYLDQNMTRDWTWKRENLGRMVSLWGNRINEMYNDKKFDKTPNRYCKWCPRHVGNDGDCTGKEAVKKKFVKKKVSKTAKRRKFT